MRDRAALRWRLVAFVIGLLMSACAPAYDEVADRLVSVAQMRFDEGAVALISAARRAEALRARTPLPPTSVLNEAGARVAFAANQSWYDAADTALNAARLRVTADPATPAQIDASFQAIQDNLDDLRRTHESQDRLGSAVLIAARREINRQYHAIMTYMLLVRSGKQPAR
ncbi:hypothetical protein [Roseomonas populi]|uniref:DUF4398 domain-containing protein n=1 Tax=Roseomonas populi TaxID=3121582 RepID=A0ABT1XCT0_9PROT|nr:hypothetical protein [Roseomonas pecuniae]MCR0985233.1 hypothetical protein [Roseomonas pecuniae]